MALPQTRPRSADEKKRILPLRLQQPSRVSCDMHESVPLVYEQAGEERCGRYTRSQRVRLIRFAQIDANRLGRGIRVVRVGRLDMTKEQPLDQDGDVAEHIAIFRPNGLGITNTNRNVQRRRSSLEIKCKPAYERVVKTARQLVSKVEERRGHDRLSKLDRDVRSTCPAESAEYGVGFAPIRSK